MSNKYLIRFNQTRGQPGRGTAEHVWRVFENNQEYLFKHLDIRVPIWDEQNPLGHWNIACAGTMKIDMATSTAIIVSDAL